MCGVDSPGASPAVVVFRFVPPQPGDFSALLFYFSPVSGAYKFYEYHRYPTALKSRSLFLIFPCDSDKVLVPFAGASACAKTFSQNEI